MILDFFGKPSLIEGKRYRVDTLCQYTLFNGFSLSVPVKNSPTEWKLGLNITAPFPYFTFTAVFTGIRMTRVEGQPHDSTLPGLAIEERVDMYTFKNGVKMSRVYCYQEVS